MLFEILTDKEIEELKERAIRQRSFYAANLLRCEAGERSLPEGQASSIALCALQRRPRYAGRPQYPGTVRTRRLADTPVSRGKRLTLFKRDDIEAAQLRISWGELP